MRQASKAITSKNVNALKAALGKFEDINSVLFVLTEFQF